MRANVLLATTVALLQTIEVVSQNVTNATQTASPTPMSAPSSAPVFIVNTTLPSLADVLVGNENLTIVTKYLNASGALDALGGTFLGTLFLPNDAAFLTFNETLVGVGRGDFLDLLLTPEWNPHLLCFLFAHAVSDKRILSTELVQGMVLEADSGNNLTVSLTPPSINNNTIIASDFEGSNGVLHVINFPILPDCVTVDILTASSSNDNFSILVRLIKMVGLESIISRNGPFTLFAPTDTAFVELQESTLNFLLNPENNATVEEILLYHLFPKIILSSDQGLHNALSGEDIFLSESRGIPVVTDFSSFPQIPSSNADIPFSNGLIHVIDKVLFNPGVINLIFWRPDQMELQQFVVLLGLGNGIETAANLTAFIFTDSAFGELPVRLQENMRDQRFFIHALRLTLAHFVVPAISSEQIFDGSRVALSTVATTDLVVDQGNRTLNGANITVADIKVWNGIVHIVDKVLAPPTMLLGITDVLKSNSSFSIMVELVELAGIAEVLNTFPSITLLAPPDSVWDPGLVDFLRTDRNTRQVILLNHIILIHLYTFEERLIFDTEATFTNFMYNKSGTFFINQAVVSPDLTYAMNGLITPLDRVLMPPRVAEFVQNMVFYDPLFNLTILERALNVAGLFGRVAEGNNFTLLAPADAAFGDSPLSKFLDEPWKQHLEFLLLNHIIDHRVNMTGIRISAELCTSGSACFPVLSTRESIFIGGARIRSANLFATNGIVHILGGLLSPEPLRVSIYDQLAMDESFSELVKWIDAAGLNATLSNTTGGPFTLFCPTNRAFAGISIDGLSAENISEILLYHGIGSNLFSSDLTSTSVTTLTGETIEIDVGSAGATINGNAIISVEKADNFAANGVFHSVSTVLLPVAFQPGPTPSPTILVPTPTPTVTSGTAPVLSCAVVFVSFWTAIIFGIS